MLIVTLCAATIVLVLGIQMQTAQQQAALQMAPAKVNKRRSA